MAKISNMFGAINSVLRKDAEVFDAPLREISADPNQPRKHFEPAEIDRLANSIRDVGLLQPLVVRRSQNGEAKTPYILVAGERRFRAMTQLGWERARVSVYGRTHGFLVASLVENTLRCDLNPIELANVYEILRDRGMAIRELAEVVGRDRTHVQNTLRLLELPDDVQDFVTEGRLVQAAARALLLLAEHPDLLREAAKRVVDESLSVPQTKHLAERMLPTAAPARKRQKAPPPPEAIELESLFASRFGTNCQIKTGRRQITITLSPDATEKSKTEAMAGMLEQVCNAIRVA
jgi:ParB family transcriptional regulator, chromosome partitioning protein